ncbi:MAG: prephenate dehydratase domain-containing protein, partial [Coriobacteriia bacterium]|nr:prephenate dehydratase domain-containing protein [Coriobacteriia bacterium]
MTRYAYLGPAGTHSHEALLAFAGPDATCDSMATIGEVFNAVPPPKADNALEPIENSDEGSVNAT